MGLVISLLPVSPASAGGCGVGELPYNVSNGGHVETEYGEWDRDKLEVNSFLYLAVGGAVTFTYRNTKYKITKNSFFKPSCFTQAGDGPYPGTWIYRGKAIVRGSDDSPKMQGVITPEAIVRTKKSGYVKYWVSRRVKDGDPNKGIVTMSVTDGPSVVLSPKVGLEGDAGCQEGQKLRINWKGEVTRP